MTKETKILSEWKRASPLWFRDQYGKFHGPFSTAEVIEKRRISVGGREHTEYRTREYTEEETLDRQW